MSTPRFRLVDLPEATSTNTYATSNVRPDANNTPVVVITDNQTAGRGQRGNSWESQPGRNLTFSLVVFPVWMSPARQFELSMLVSVGIVNALQKFTDTPEWFRVKWPNDIYFADRKIAGILIENTIGSSAIERSVIGIGLNVNQLQFVSDAPNPISLIHVTGLELDRKKILDAVVESILDMIDTYADEPDVDQLTALYNSMLWRNDGRMHPWRLPDGQRLEAAIVGVAPDGRLSLVDSKGDVHTYLFKEIAAEL